MMHIIFILSLIPFAAIGVYLLWLAICWVLAQLIIYGICVPVDGAVHGVKSANAYLDSKGVNIDINLDYLVIGFIALATVAVVVFG